jgi:hypothetical protein
MQGGERKKAMNNIKISNERDKGGHSNGRK